jgi:hypothetical protein
MTNRTRILMPWEVNARFRHEPWMGRFVLWATVSGVTHVALRSAMVGRGIVSLLACVRSTNMVDIEATTWYAKKRQRPRFCRECLAILRAAGETGSVVALAKKG